MITAKLSEPDEEDIFILTIVAVLGRGSAVFLISFL